MLKRKRERKKNVCGHKSGTLARDNNEHAFITWNNVLAYRSRPLFLPPPYRVFSSQYSLFSLFSIFTFIFHCVCPYINIYRVSYLRRGKTVNSYRTLEYWICLHFFILVSWALTCLETCTMSFIALHHSIILFSVLQSLRRVTRVLPQPKVSWGSHIGYP